MGELAFIAPSTANRGDEFVIPVDSCTLPIPDHKTKQKYTHTQNLYTEGRWPPFQVTDVSSTLFLGLARSRLP